MGGDEARSKVSPGTAPLEGNSSPHSVQYTVA